MKGLLRESKNVAEKLVARTAHCYHSGCRWLVAKMPPRIQKRLHKWIGDIQRRDGKLKSDLARALQVRAANLVDASQPIVLIGQLQRSGGTLLNQLFDGHPQLHVYPPEFKIGGGQVWPAIDMAAGPDVWWQALHESQAAQALHVGYRKDRVAQRLGHVVQLESFPFILVSSFQRRLFHALIAEQRVERPRDVLGCYLTAYFNAWLDNQNLYSGPKRWTVGFRGKLALPNNLAAFFRDYPDGCHVTCVRDPVERTASKYVMHGSQRDLASHVNGWCRHTGFQLDAKERYGERVFLVMFDWLIDETDAVMRALAAWLGIAFDPILTMPTFNRCPIKANSSFAIAGSGVRREVREHWKTVLNEQQAAEIQRHTREMYERARARANAI
jgi:hypothetical protein